MGVWRRRRRRDDYFSVALWLVSQEAQARCPRVRVRTPRAVCARNVNSLCVAWTVSPMTTGVS